MRHKLQVRLSPELAGGVVQVHQARLRDRITRRLFGKSQRFAVLIPGGSVDEVTIIEQADDLMAVADAAGVIGEGGDGS